MNVKYRHMVLMMAATLWFGCGGSGDEPGGSSVPQPNGDAPISFSGSLGEGESESHARTRTTTNPLSVTHQTFYAWAYKNPASGGTETVMQNYTVNWQENTIGSTATNSRGWEYVNQQESGTVQSIKYWDFSAANYRFFGYTGDGVSKSYSPNSTSPTQVTISFHVDATTANLDLSGDDADEIPLYSKLWYKTGPQLTSDPVQLVFLQPYVRVRFLFRQSEPAETVFTLTDISFKPTNDLPIARAGTFKVTYPLSVSTTTEETEETWDVDQVTEDQAKNLSAFTEDYYVKAEDGFNRENAPATIEGEKKWYTVIPAKDQGTYTLTVTVNGEVRTVVVPAKYMNWQPGYEYTYLFQITERGIVELVGLQSGFAEWVQKEAGHSIYNW